MINDRRSKSDRSESDECRPRDPPLGGGWGSPTSVVEVVQGEVIEKVATREYVG
jgi:hypothetical protein